ncbi:MAG TPA: PIG-L deacetylase family protein [Candidatus Krumholzibacteria bacterium]|nr:PIG-L deacetylase family protein [Candidatus Krumholzibacteria bacterium]
MKKRLLCVFAHPDDESYGPGGTIAQCALDGVDVFITMFTAGEAGSIGISKSLAPEELARRRRIEMADACRALGVGGYRMLEIPDGRVSGMDANRAVGEILSDIERFQPQVVVTFHHRGVSGHPDHIAVAGFLDQAFARSGDAGPARYYEFGIPRHKAPLYERPNLVPLNDEEIAARVDIRPEAMERKVAAIQAHVTQVAFFESLEARFDYRTVSTPEHFGLRRTRAGRPSATVGDLFEGIDD